MTCIFCGIDPKIVIPVPFKKNGAIESFSCKECAVKAGLYCEKHERPHIGFMGDNSTACLKCIEEEVQDKKQASQEVYEQLRKALPQREWERVEGEIELSSAITGDEHPVSLLRFIVTRAHRLEISSEEVVKQILHERSVSLILPNEF